MRVYLIRHGETAWSVSGQHTGCTDLALSPHGEDQARLLRPALRDIRFSRVLTSPLQRARQTCRLAGLGEQGERDADLGEWNYGAYEGRTSADIRTQRPAWSVFRDGCPDGETPQDVSDRADRLILRLAAVPGTLALFSHGHFGCSLAARWIGMPIAAAGHFSLGTASISVLAERPGEPDIRVLESWNFTPWSDHSAGAKQPR